MSSPQSYSQLATELSMNYDVIELLKTKVSKLVTNLGVSDFLPTNVNHLKRAWFSGSRCTKGS